MNPFFITRRILAALLIAASVVLPGCMGDLAQLQGGGRNRNSPSIWSSMTAAKAPDDERATAQTGIVNHTGEYVHRASVNGAGGGGMSAWGAGGANICCTSIPNVWHPGMMVLVRWSVRIDGIDVWKEKTVEVEKYDEPGSLFMHFFPNDEVRVVVSNADGYSKKHPIPPPVKPAWAIAKEQEQLRQLLKQAQEEEREQKQ